MAEYVQEAMSDRVPRGCAAGEWGRGGTGGRAEPQVWKDETPECRWCPEGEEGSSEAARLLGGLPAVWPAESIREEAGLGWVEAGSTTWRKGAESGARRALRGELKSVGFIW